MSFINLIDIFLILLCYYSLHNLRDSLFKIQIKEHYTSSVKVFSFLLKK